MELFCNFELKRVGLRCRAGCCSPCARADQAEQAQGKESEARRERWPRGLAAPLEPQVGIAFVRTGEVPLSE
eukprot:13835800-Alexandrium_andersonii.AAC.1